MSAEAVLTASLRDEISRGLDTIRGNLGGLGGIARDAFAFATGGLIQSGIEGIASAAANGIGSVVGFAADAAQGQRDLQAQLGITAQEADRLGDVAQEVFAQNWYGSIGEATEAVGLIRQQLGDLSDQELAQVAASVNAIGDTFDAEAPQVIDAVKAIRDNFPGTTEAQALDFITSGFQKGLNASGDFLESIGEYAVQFKDSEATAAQFFSVLETGQQAGVLGTDKIADAFKESRIRIMEMSEEVVAAFSNIGEAAFSRPLAKEFGQVGPLFIDTAEKADAVNRKLREIGLPELPVEDLLLPLTIIDEKTGAITERAQKFEEVFTSQLAGSITNGTISVADAQQIVIDGLREMGEGVYQNTAGVKIFGTQWEDLGPSALLAVDMAKTSLDDLAGATDSLNVKYENFGAMWEGFKRQALVALQPLADGTLALANEAMPLATAAMTGLVAVLTTVVGYVQSLRPTLDGVIAAFQSWLPTIQPVIDLLGANLQPILTAVAGVLTGVVVVAIGSAIAAFVSATAPILALIAIGAVLVAAWNSNFGGIRDITTQVMAAVQETIGTVLAAVQEFWTAHGDEVMALVGALRDFLEETFRNAMQIIGGIVNTVLAVIRGDWDAAAEGIGQTVDGLMAQVQLLFRTGMSLLEGIVGPPIDAVVGFFTDMPKRVKDVGKNIVKAVEDGFRQAWDDFMKLATANLDAFRNLWPFSEPRDTSSPLYGLGKSGAAIIEMVQAGIDGAGGLTIPGATFGAPNGSLALAGAGVVGSAQRLDIAFRVTVDGSAAAEPAVLDAYEARTEAIVERVIDRLVRQGARLGRNGEA
jgi:phage-related protein